jgi:hypothetical protein
MTSHAASGPVPGAWTVSGLELALVRAAVVLSPIENSVLQATPLGFFGAGVAVIPLLLAGALRLMLLVGGHERVNRRVVLALVLIGAYAALVTIFGMVRWGASSHGEFLPAKAIKNLLLIITFALMIWYVARHFVQLRAAILAAFALSLLGVVLVALVPALDAANGLFSYQENKNLRPRGFALESSTLGAQVAVYGLVTAAMVRSTLARVLVIALAGLVVIYSDSKGTIAAFSLALVIAPLAVRLSVAGRIAALAIGVGVLALGFGLVMDMLLTDLESTTSTGTRSVMAVLALTLAGVSGVGTGLGAYLPAISEWGPAVVDFIERLGLPAGALREVQEYIDGTTAQAVSFKTFVADSIAWFGVPMLLATIWVWWKTWQRLKSQSLPLMMLFFFITLGFGTFLSGYGFYAQALGVGVLASHWIARRGGATP